MDKLIFIGARNLQEKATERARKKLFVFSPLREEGKVTWKKVTARNKGDNWSRSYFFLGRRRRRRSCDARGNKKAQREKEYLTVPKGEE